MIRAFPTISTDERNHVLIGVNTYRRTDVLAQTEFSQEISMPMKGSVEMQGGEEGQSQLWMVRQRR